MKGADGEAAKVEEKEKEGKKKSIVVTGIFIK
jgi:hypothetical protein